MFRKNAFFALLLLVTATLWSCKKDGESNPTPAAPASMECKVNNVSWKALTFQNTLTQVTTTLFTGKQLGIRGTAADGSTIVLTVSEPSTTATGGIKPDTYHINVFENLPPDYQSDTPAKGAAGMYMSGLPPKIYASSLDAPQGKIVITACDPAKKTVSGTFFYEATNFIDDTSVNVTTGTFTNLSYQ
jgi:hypothetical protein